MSVFCELKHCGLPEEPRFYDMGLEKHIEEAGFCAVYLKCYDFPDIITGTVRVNGTSTWVRDVSLEVEEITYDLPIGLGDDTNLFTLEAQYRLTDIFDVATIDEIPVRDLMREMTEDDLDVEYLIDQYLVNINLRSEGEYSEDGTLILTRFLVSPIAEAKFTIVQDGFEDVVGYFNAIIHNDNIDYMPEFNNEEIMMCSTLDDAIRVLKTEIDNVLSGNGWIDWDACKVFSYRWNLVDAESYERDMGSATEVYSAKDDPDYAEYVDYQ